MTLKQLFTDERTKRFKIGLRDIFFSVYYAVGGSISVVVIETLGKDRLPTFPELKVAAIAGLTVGMQHILRKYFTGPKQ